MRTDEFLAEYIYMVDKDFKGPDGTPVQWAEGQPASWGWETKKIKLESNTNSAAIAVDPSGTLLAVAHGKEVKIYSISTCDLLETLIGHTEDVRKIVFSPNLKGSGFTLASSSNQLRGTDNMSIIWELDAFGRDIHPPPSKPEVETLTNKASEAVMKELIQHGWTDEEKASKNLKEGFHQTIAMACLEHSPAHRNPLDGSFFSFGSDPFDSTGKRLFYKTNNTSTQGGMRAADELPCINVWNIETQKTELELRGHTDAIMWAGSSPNDKLIASAAWDQTIRIWDLESGECKFTFGPFGGQMWAGTFSPDSKHIAFSVGNPTTIVFVYSLETGEEISRMEGSSTEGIRHWARSMDWSPDGSLLSAGGSGGQLCIWDPFTGEEKQQWQLEGSGRVRAFLSVWGVQFIDGGRKLLFKTADGSIEVYDFTSNRKWHFGKGKDDVVKSGTGEESLCWIGEKNMLVSADNDGSVRFWSLAIA